MNNNRFSESENQASYILPQSNIKVQSFELKPWQRDPRALEIAAGLDRYQGLPLTPVRLKSPYRKNWQHEEPVDHAVIRNAILNGETLTSKNGNQYKSYATGYGLRTGHGLIALDVDGETPEQILRAMSGGDIPETLTWTSGKPGRRQLLYRLPENIANDPDVQKFTRRPVQEFNGITSPGNDALDFRYSRNQSVLPPSTHPNTGKYQIVDDAPIAVAPQWVCDWVLKFAKEEVGARVKKTTTAKTRKTSRGQGFTSDTPLTRTLSELVNRGGIETLYDWAGHKFIDCGAHLEGCCPVHKSESGRSFHVDKNTFTWYCFGCANNGVYGGGVKDYREWLFSHNLGVKYGQSFGGFLKDTAKQLGVNLTNSVKKLIRKIFAPSFKLGETKELRLSPDLANFPHALDFQGKVPPRLIVPNGVPMDDVLHQAIAMGWQNILNSSWVGTGKSYDTADITNGNDPVLLVAADHNNPDYRIYDRYTNLWAAHGGLWGHTDGKLRRYPIQKDDPPDIVPNCIKPDLRNELSSKGFDAGLACLDCALADKGCSFKSQRKRTMSHQYIRCYVSQLPYAQEKDVSEAIVSYDEAIPMARGLITRRSLSLEDLALLRSIIKLHDQELFRELESFFDSLESLFLTDFKANPWGLKKESLMELIKLPNNPEFLIEELEDLFNNFQIDLSGLIPDRAILGDIMQALTGGGNVRITPHGDKGKPAIVVALPDRRFREFITKTKLNVYLDATGDRDTLTACLGLESDQLLEVRKELPPMDNLTVFNTDMSGLRSRDYSTKLYSPKAMDRIKVYQEYCEGHYGEGNVSYLGIKGAFEFYWGPDNRATNVFKGKPNLVTFGSPFPNISAIEDEYFALEIKESFEDYYSRIVGSEYLQLIGRQRAHRFPDRQFTLDIVGTGLNLDFLKDFGIKVINRNIDDICPLASGDRVLSFTAQFKEVLSGFKAGDSVDQASLAAKMGFSQNRFSELIKKMMARFDCFGDSWLALKSKISTSLYSLYKTFDKILDSNDDALDPPDSNTADYLIWAAIEADLGGNPDSFTEYLGQLDKSTREMTLGLLLKIAAPA